MNRKPNALRTVMPLLGLALALAMGGCGVLGHASKTDDPASGSVNGEFHNAYYLAQVAKLKGDAAGAREALLRCLDADPTASVVHYELARLDREAEQWASARDAILKAIDLDEDNPWYHAEWADVAMELGLFDEADEAWEWLLVNKPQDDLSAGRLLDLRAARGDVEGALAVVDVLEREWGPDPEWHFERHRLHMAAGNVEAGLEALIRLEVDFPDVVEGIVQRIRILTTLGRDAEAEEVLRNAMSRSDHGRLHLEWAHLLTRRGDTEEAREHVRAAFDSDDVPLQEKADIAWTYVELSEIQIDLRPETQRLIDALVAAHPDEPEPFDILAAFRLAEGDEAGALEALNQALDRGGNSPDRWLEACQLAADLRDWPGVDALGERAGTLFPNLPVFPYFRGLALLEMGDDKAAERQLRMARNLIVDRPEFESDILSSLAQIAHDRGDDAESDQWFEMAIEAYPQNLIALNNYAYYLALRGQKLDRAKELAARVVGLAPGDANFEDTYAWVLFRSGEAEEALTWIELSLAHEGDRPGAAVLDHSGDILWALGRKDEARAKWQAAKAAGGDADALQLKIDAE